MFHGSSWCVLGAILAGLAVATGAFAAHGLDKSFALRYGEEVITREYKDDATGKTIKRETPKDRKFLADFKTATEYQMYHALALLALGLVMQQAPSTWLTAAGWLFLIGSMGFSGGLYAYTLTDQKWIGMLVVPTGGVLFLLGWMCFALGAWGCCSTKPSPVT